MMRISFPGLIAVACMMLGGCTSAPVYYYTLVGPNAATNSATDSGANTGIRSEQGTAAPFLIEVLPVGIPQQVDQMQLVVRQDESTISVLDNERWSAPLNEELRGALSLALSQRLNTQDVQGLPRVADKPVLRVKLEVRRFESQPGRYALLDADWSLTLARDADNARLLCHSHLQQAVGGDYASLVRGHQQAIVALAGQIAGVAGNWVASRQATCP